MLIRRAFFRVAFMTVLAWAGVLPAQAPLVPVTVCEVVVDLPSHQGKNYAVVGRYSFREKGGRTLNEQACAAPGGGPLQLLLVETATGPKPPDSFEIDRYELARKFDDIQTRTALGKFRFGTPDYDRWVVVYGRVETPARTGSGAAANLAFRGDGAILFLTASR
jgi:hypothetical protein